MQKIILVLLLMLPQMPNWINAQEGSSKTPVIITGHPARPPFIYRDGDQIVGLGPEFAGLVLSKSVFVKKEKVFLISTRKDLEGWRGVTLFDDSFGDQMDRFMTDHLRMIRAYSLELTQITILPRLMRTVR